MGSCLSSPSISSSSASVHQKPGSAYVVSATGKLHQYPVPVTVSQVLETSDDSFFLCNSDRLHFDDYIPSLHPDEELQPSQIYFLLPASRLRQRLAASDMAALAVKASLALEQIDNRRRKSRISPVFVSEEDHTQSSNHEINQLNMIGSSSHSSTISSSTEGFSRSDSVTSTKNHRKLLKGYSSRRAKLAIRSFRLRLSTIQEGSMHRSSSIEIQDNQQFP